MNTIDTHAALEAHFELHRVLNVAPRLAWGVVRDGVLTYSGGTNTNENTVFRIASMTKSFTAAAVLMLRDEGAFALDDPIIGHAPELASIANPTADSPAITIRHLLTMNSGLATDDPWADRHLDFSDAQLDAETIHGALFAVPPGTSMQYSNMGYALLGRVVLRVTGATVQQHVSQRILPSLDMNSTAWSVETLPNSCDIAIGQERIGGEFEPVEMVGDGTIAPMGGLFTTVADLAKWVAFFADAYPARDELDLGVVCRASRREMQQSTTSFLSETRVGLDGLHRVIRGGYGMGLTVLQHEQLGAVVSHSGGVPGYGSNMRWVRNANFGLIGLANVTYARMADATASALDLVNACEPIQMYETPMPRHLKECCEALVALLNDWADARAESLFSDNVAMDRAYLRRSHEATALIERVGTLRMIDMQQISAAEADLVVRGANSERDIRIELQLSSQLPARVQFYEILE